MGRKASGLVPQNTRAGDPSYNLEIPCVDECGSGYQFGVRRKSWFRITADVIEV